MRHFVLIACASKKQPQKSPAADLYLSDLYRKSLRYGRTLNPDGIFILSAKHGLLPLQQEIEPYDVTLNEMPAAERRAWADRVLRELARVADLEQDRFTLLAGDRYREHLVPRLRHSSVPLEGLRIGQQLSFLKEALDHE